MSVKEFIFHKITKGINRYHEVVKKMSDKELIEHVYADNDFQESDFAYQEMLRRGIAPRKPQP